MTRDERFLRQAYPDEAALAPRLERLHAGEPLAYLLGEWDFYDLTFALTPDTLIPRPDTECLVEYLIRHLPPNAHFCDLCTGSGCIAITVLHHRPDTTALAIEKNEGALAVAAENAKRHGVENRLTLQGGDVLYPLELGAPDCIVSNPPYIASSVVDTLDESVRCYEPRMALDGGADGLVFYRAILRHHLPHLKQGGFAVFEIGYDQGQALQALSAQSGYYCQIHKDYAHNDRVAVLGAKSR